MDTDARVSWRKGADRLKVSYSCPDNPALEKKLCHNQSKNIKCQGFLFLYNGGYKFRGIVEPCGVDTQTVNAAGVRHMSARYMLTGADADGRETRIYVENNGWFDDLTKTMPFHVAAKDLFRDITPPGTLWKDYNEAAYRVMRKYGDGHKQVILTATGFTDLGDPELETLYAGYNKTILQIASELPYVRTLYNFRQLCENAMLKRAGIEENQIG